jgi:hypothetical protein
MPAQVRSHVKGSFGRVVNATLSELVPCPHPPGRPAEAALRAMTVFAGPDARGMT